MAKVFFFLKKKKNPKHCFSFFPFKFSVLYFCHIYWACLFHLCSALFLDCYCNSLLSLRSWKRPDISQKFLIQHFKQGSCLKASLATKPKSCKKVLFSAKSLWSFSYASCTHPSRWGFYLPIGTCQVQPLPDASFEGWRLLSVPILLFS